MRKSRDLISTLVLPAEATFILAIAGQPVARLPRHDALGHRPGVYQPAMRQLGATKWYRARRASLLASAAHHFYYRYHAEIFISIWRGHYANDAAALLP